MFHPSWNKSIAVHIAKMVIAFVMAFVIIWLVQWPLRSSRVSNWRSLQTHDALLDIKAIHTLVADSSVPPGQNADLSQLVTVPNSLARLIAKGELNFAPLPQSESPPSLASATPQTAWSIEPNGFHRLKVSIAVPLAESDWHRLTIVRRYDAHAIASIMGNPYLFPSIFGIVAVFGASLAQRFSVHRDLQRAWMQRMITRIQNGQWQISQKDVPRGDTRWIQGIYALADTMHGKVLEVQKLNENSSRAMTNMPIGVLSFNGKLTLEFANPAAKQLLGIEKATEGQKLVEVIRTPSILDCVIATHHSGVPQEIEMEIASTKSWLRIKSQALDPSPPRQNEMGIAVLLTISDETRLKQLENLRRDFTANVSHELKTPLAAIKAYAETLSMGALEDPHAAGRFVERISEQAARLDALIRDLLQLTRLQSQPEKPELTNLWVEDCLESAVEDHRPIAESKGIEIKLHIESNCRILSELESLQTILSNLLSNAIRYNKEQGTVSVSAFQRDACCVVRIADTGIGIPPEDLDRIFERFYRVEKARSQELGGTGLGLAIVKHLCQSVSAQIHVESELGAGTTFELQLPVVQPNR